LNFKANAESWSEAIMTGNRLALVKAITLMESTRPEDKKMAGEILKFISTPKDKSLRIGVTGAPGVGKSTLIEALGMAEIESGNKPAVLSIDPSSMLTKGSILGDKSRMVALSARPEAYVRPSSAGIFLGGLASHTYESLLLCEAAGFNRIFIETVGTGQSEISVFSLCDITLLLIQPGSGDDLQAIKKGIMEWADVFVVTKDDGEFMSKASLTFRDVKTGLGFHNLENGFIQKKVMKASVLDQKSISALRNHIEECFNILVANNQLKVLRGKHLAQFFNLEWPRLLQDYLMQDEKTIHFIEELTFNLENSKLDLENAIQKLIRFIFARHF
jgi:LAO/AO transport system kinase